ncbi:hypothetical protein [Parvularcula dongshanensis]|uniref:Uncharacterized protein n=1 Tax=Parvularcula dongshanensis TaxID=1173995 RepID=A0A840I0E4_9PROT|nr:hypothetical protein [Parvularcula dongshanensis]MBB4657682.1 hypothetical protein [Parvularcula dongshanensis]
MIDDPEAPIETNKRFGIAWLDKAPRPLLPAVIGIIGLRSPPSWTA